MRPTVIGMKMRLVPLQCEDCTLKTKLCDFSLEIASDFFQEVLKQNDILFSFSFQRTHAKCARGIACRHMGH